MSQFNNLSAESAEDSLATVSCAELPYDGAGFPGCGDGSDDLADANANEVDDYADEGADDSGDAVNEIELDDYYAEANDEAYFDN